MYDLTSTVRPAQLIAVFFAWCAVLLFSGEVARAQSAPLGTLIVNKVVTGTTTSPALFSFLINGASSTAFEADGTNELMLPVGQYAITETPVAGFTASYEGCGDIHLSATTTSVCTITNTATSTGANGTSTPGTLTVIKVVSGGTSPASAFSFTIDGAATTTFEQDGTNSISGLEPGTYTVVEVPFANYTPAYNNCASADVVAGATTTCTITNTFNVGGGQLYEITGIVWDDDDEDGAIDAGESRLENWTVSASQTGEITRTDASDANGRYALLVSDGPWLVSLTPQSGWTQTFPASITHTVQATGTATTTLVLGDYNFGNNQTVVSGGGGGGGNGRRIELRDSNGNDEDEDDDSDEGDSGSIGSGSDGGGGGTQVPPLSIPGVVLGEQTSVFPYGAPSTGGGGSQLQRMDGSASLPLIFLVMVFLVGFGAVRGIRDLHEEEKTL